MSDHPSTFNAAETNPQGVEWEDRASIHQKHDGQGVLDSMKALHSGTLAEMVSMITNMPDREREGFVIQKAGDHRLDAGEIMALARREDFPARK